MLYHCQEQDQDLDVYKRQAVVHIKHDLSGISVVIAEVEHDIRLGASEAIDLSLIHIFSATT